MIVVQGPISPRERRSAASVIVLSTASSFMNWGSGFN
jgi:hypothetical protein